MNDLSMIEIPVGGTFTFGHRVKVECCEDKRIRADCEVCCFYHKEKQPACELYDYPIVCGKGGRTDKKHVYFREVSCIL